MGHALKDILEKVLRQNGTFVSNDGILLKNSIRQKAEDLDETLITLLLDNEVLREAFFVVIKDVRVFNSGAFIKFMHNKEFLPDSYTSFKNKIGLTTEYRDFIASSNEVVLSFPFKDCVLLGGQDKDDQKRDEIFYNEVLGKDDIDRLFDKKVFTNFKRVNKHGIHVLEWFRRDMHGNLTDNLIIKWNNLIALHSLKSNFSWKVKLIYIDPPYNTGSDSFNYNDRFNHSTWLTFMKNRFEIAKELLRDDWAIFVQCDDNEQAYVKVLMDEIFWKWNFRECIAVKTSTPSWVNAINVKRGERLFKLKEYILFYSKKESFRFYPVYIKSNYNENYKYEVIKEGNQYHIRDVSKDFGTKEEYIQYCLKHNNHIYSLEKNNKKAWEKIKHEIEKSRHTKGVIEYINNQGNLTLVYNWWVLVPLRERIVTEWNKQYFWTLISDFWDDEVFQSTKTEGWVAFSNAKKPEKLLKRILELWSQPWDIVLDYHLWSATTCAVAHKMHRQYIGIEQMDYIEDVSMARMQQVIEGEQSGISNSVHWNGGGDVVYMELLEENHSILTRIQRAQTLDDLYSIYDTLKKSEYIHYTINPEEINIESLSEKDRGNFVKFLMEIVDKNILYKHFSEIHDKNSNISTYDKEINHLFYI